jgi:hypothetical protein
MRKGERIAPEEPLEACYGGAHNGQPDEREGRLPAGEARIEEATLSSMLVD